MKQGKIALVLIQLILISPVNCINLGISGGSGESSGLVDTKIDAADSASVKAVGSIDGADLSPSVSSTGRLNVFKQMHSVTDSTIRYAGTYVIVINGQNVKYISRIPSRDEDLMAQSQAFAEAWLTIQSADYTDCTAQASYPYIGIEHITIL